MDAQQAQTPVREPIFNISSDYYGIFLEKFAKVARKGRKLQGREIKPEIVGEFPKEVGKDAYGRPVFRTYFKVRVDADPVKVEGYTFIATIDHVNKSGNIVSALPGTGVELPESYRTAKPYCAHCNSQRTRRNTYVLRCDETGEFSQIGRNCLADFIGRDPKEVAARAAWLSECLGIGGDSGDDFDGAYGMRDRRTIHLLDFLAHTAAMIRVFGWVSGAMAKASEDMRSTASRAYENMYPPKDAKTGRYTEAKKVTDEDKALAQASLEWAQGLAKKSHRSDYEHNILVIASEPYIEYKSNGLAASIVSSHLRAQEKLKIAKREAVDTANSVYVGEVGKRINFGKVRVIMAFSGESGGFFVHRYKFATSDGNVLFWSASSSQGLVQGREVMLLGTVKSHDEYQGQKSTRITRCKIEPVS